MTFQQLLFPFVFLPLAILLFRVTPERFRKATRTQRFIREAPISPAGSKGATG